MKSNMALKYKETTHEPYGVSFITSVHDERDASV